MADMIRRVLIANRGEIAIRIARAARELDIVPLGIASEADRDALHRSAMDESIIIGPARAGESYLNIERILEAAKTLEADAVHPGYGFLSERADFAQAVIDAGLKFIGPSPETLALAGDKRAARHIAQSIGIATLEGYDGDELGDAELAEKAQILGFPVLIKASNGGGGRGQRVVHAPEEFLDALAQARREAKAAFGDESVLLERYIRRPRHIEMQILADAHGNIICIGERDCSLQRRRQKVIEEAPAPNLDSVTRESMADAAIALARATNYRSAGTVEFLLDEDHRWYFLEINARLQVEHPVTELVHGIDIVTTQFHIANGAAIAFDRSPARGWAVEARICAEDPAYDLLPSCGTISHVAFPSGDGIRIDSGITSGSVVPIDYDSLLAKLCVFAETREAAFSKLADALAQTSIEGIATNLPTLRAIVDDAHVRQGVMHTTYLDESGLLAAPRTDTGISNDIVVQATQVLLARHPHARVSSVGIPLFFTVNDQRYAVEATRNHAQWHCSALQLPGIVTEVIEPFHCAVVTEEATAAIDLEQLQVALVSPLTWRDTKATTAVQSSKLKNSVKAPMPGRVLRLTTQVGAIVDEHDVIAILEAMKMEHRIEAGLSGVVTHVHIQEGDVVPAGTLLFDIAKGLPAT